MLKKIYTGLLTFCAVALLCQCDSAPRQQRQPTVEELYQQSVKGDQQARKQLLSRQGQNAGTFQEKLGDELAYTDPELAEQCWKAAKSNGVQDGGPDSPVLFFIRKHWFVAGVMPLCSICLVLYLVAVSGKRGQQTPQRRSPGNANSSAERKPIPRNSVLFIDTNIWMNPELHPWFARLKKVAPRYSWSIILETIVLGELKGLSKNAEKSKDARMGARRIEKLQEITPTIISVADHSTPQDTVADSVLLRTARQTPNAILITDDRELRIKARGQNIAVLGSENL